MSVPSVVVDGAPEGWTHIGGPSMHLLIALDEDDEQTLAASDAADGGDLDDVVDLLTTGGMRRAHHFVGVHWQPRTRLVAHGPVAITVTLADGTEHEVRPTSSRVWTDLELAEHPAHVRLRVLDESDPAATPGHVTLDATTTAQAPPDPAPGSAAPESAAPEAPPGAAREPDPAPMPEPGPGAPSTAGAEPTHEPEPTHRAAPARARAGGRVGGVSPDRADVRCRRRDPGHVRPLAVAAQLGRHPTARHPTSRHPTRPRRRHLHRLLHRLRPPPRIGRPPRPPGPRRLRSRQPHPVGDVRTAAGPSGRRVDPLRPSRRAAAGPPRPRLPSRHPPSPSGPATTTSSATRPPSTSTAGPSPSWTAPRVTTRTSTTRTTRPAVLAPAGRLGRRGRRRPADRRGTRARRRPRPCRRRPPLHPRDGLRRAHLVGALGHLVEHVLGGGRPRARPRSRRPSAGGTPHPPRRACCPRRSNPRRASGRPSPAPTSRPTCRPPRCPSRPSSRHRQPPVEPVAARRARSRDQPPGQQGAPPTPAPVRGNQNCSPALRAVAPSRCTRPRARARRRRPTIPRRMTTRTTARVMRTTTRRS